MRIVFVIPPFDYGRSVGHVRRGARRGVLPPLGVGFLAAELRKHGHACRLVDAMARNLNAAETAEAVAALRPETVGISLITFVNERESVETCREIRRRVGPDVPIILGGPDNDRLRALLAEKPVIRALPADRPPTLTGRIDDPLWQSAEPVRRFYRLPRAADPAVETEVRAIIAGQTLFLAVRCQEPEMAALRTAATAERGNIWSDDSIEVYFDPAGSGESYYYIQANAAGEAVLNNSATGRLNVGLVARPGRFDAGWTLELAIPLGELGGLPPGARAIGFNIHRNRTMDRGAMSWSWGGQSYHAPEHFGRLEF